MPAMIPAKSRIIWNIENETKKLEKSERKI